MPFTHAFHHLPSNAPIWQKALYGAGVFADVGMWALPATKLVAPAFKLGMESKLLSNIFKTTSLETKAVTQSIIQAEKAGAKLVTERALATKNKVAIDFLSKEAAKFKGNQWKFPKDPKNFLKDLIKDPKGRIYTSDNLRIRSEEHLLKPGETFNPRHHGQHYHVETRINPNKPWRANNIEKIKPKNYQPGEGSGFLPGEYFPGIEG